MNPFSGKANTKVGRSEDDGPGSQTQNAPTEASAPHSRPNKKPGFWKLVDWKLMLALLFPVTLETLDYTVVATAQSQIASVFNALPLESYIGTLYLLASAVFLPLFASIADIYGRHFGLQLSLLFFLVGSALSTGAVNMPMILAGRGIAGIGAAGLLTRSLLFHCFGRPQIVRTVLSDSMSLDKNNIQQSMLSLLYLVGSSIGPVIGGFLVLTNFRWVFAINLPCTVVGMFLCFFFLRNRSRVHEVNGDRDQLEAATLNPTSTSRRTPMATVDSWVSKLALIDWVGTFLFVTGGILVLLALNWGPDDNWKSARVIVNIVLGAVLIVLCICWQILLKRRSPSPPPNGTGPSSQIHTRHTGVFSARPMLPIELFTSYDMCVVQYGSFISGIILFVMFYFVAIFATVVTGLPPSQAGIQLLYFAPGLGGGSFLSIRMIKLFRQPIYPIVLGSVIMTVGVGLVQMAVQHNNQNQLNGFMAMVGVGVGMNAPPLGIHARFTKPNHVAITNAMLLFFRAFGGTVGLAQCFTILNAKVNAYVATQIAALLNSGTLTSDDLSALTSLLDSGGLTSVTSLDGLSTVVQGVVKGAFSDGVRWAFLSLVPWLGVGCLVSVFLSRIEDSDKVVEPKEEVEGEPKREGSEVELVQMKPQPGVDLEGGVKVSTR